MSDPTMAWEDDGGPCAAAGGDVAGQIIVFFTQEGYRFDPHNQAYYAMVDGWKHDLGSDEFPGTWELERRAEDLTAEDWRRIIDALTSRYREGLIAGMDTSPYVPFTKEQLTNA